MEFAVVVDVECIILMTHDGDGDADDALVQ